MSRISSYAALLILFFLTGCVNYLQTKFAYSEKMYPGPYKARDEIVVLAQNESQKVHLEKIDGNSLEIDFGVVFELLPGRHTLCVRLSYNEAYSKSCQTVEFTGQAGHIYEFYSVEDDVIEKWYPVVRDITDVLSTPANPSAERTAKRIEAMMLNARNK